MARSDQFELGSRYDFTTFSPAIFGNFNNVLVNAITDYRMAFKYIDVAARHVDVFGYLPPGTAPNDFTKYPYLIITTPNGNTTALGLPWIQEGSVMLRGRSRIRVTIEDVGPDDIEKVREALSSNNFTVSEVTLD